MKISKRVGRMALEAAGTAPEGWPWDVWATADHMITSPYEPTLLLWSRKSSNASDTLLCLIASIAGVK